VRARSEAPNVVIAAEKEAVHMSIHCETHPDISGFTVSAVDFVPGRPNVYGLFYPNVKGWYIGKNETGDATYMGSPSDAVRTAIRQAHLSLDAPIRRRCVAGRDSEMPCRGGRMRFL
jgi:hypothetical protein